MGKNLIPAVLVGLLAISCVFSAVFAVVYVRGVGELRFLQSEAIRINQRQTMLQSLVNDATAYSRHNPAIDPILQAVGAKPKPQPPAPQNGMMP